MIDNNKKIKYKPHLSIFKISLIYLLSSGFLWGIISIVFLINTNLTSFEPFNTYIYNFHVFFYYIIFPAVFVIIISFLFGILIAIPTVLTIPIFPFDIPKIKKMTAKTKFIRFIYVIWRPLLCIFSHIFIIFLSMGSIPYYIKYKFNIDLMSDITLKINNIFYSEKYVNHENSWDWLNDIKDEKNFYILIENTTLNNRDYFKGLNKKIINKNILLTETNLFNYINNLLNNTETNKLTLLPTNSFNNINDIINKPDLFLKMQINKTREQYDAWNIQNFLEHRIFLSQLHLFFLFRFNLFESIFDMSSWENLVFDNSKSLLDFIKQSKEQNKKNNLLVIDDINKYSYLFPFNKENYITDDNIKLDNMLILEKILNYGINIALKSDNIKIAIIPYPSLFNTDIISKAYFSDNFVSISKDLNKTKYIESFKLQYLLNINTNKKNNICTKINLLENIYSFNKLSDLKVEKMIFDLYKYLEIKNDKYLYTDKDINQYISLDKSSYLCNIFNNKIIFSIKDNKQIKASFNYLKNEHYGINNAFISEYSEPIIKKPQILNKKNMTKKSYKTNKHLNIQNLDKEKYEDLTFLALFNFYIINEKLELKTLELEQIKNMLLYKIDLIKNIKNELSIPEINSNLLEPLPNQ